MNRELLRLGELDAGRCQRILQAAIPCLLPGVLRCPDLADAEVRLLTEHDVELEGWRGPVGAILLKDLVDLVVLLARQRRRRVANEDGHGTNLTDGAIHAQEDPRRRRASLARGRPHNRRSAVPALPLAPAPALRSWGARVPRRSAGADWALRL